MEYNPEIHSIECPKCGHGMTEITYGGDVVIDRVKGGMMGEKVQLPDEYAGKLMVFKVGDRMSFGLIISAEREIGKLDFIRNP